MTRSVVAGLVLVSLAVSNASGGERIAYLASTGSYWQVWTVAPDGAEPKPVTSSSYEKARCSWYPDGRHILVNALDGRLFKVDSELGDETPIPIPLQGTNDAAVSPSGKWIAFSLSTAGSVDDNEIWVIDTHGQNLRKLTRMPALQHDPAWSADGRWIYFLSGDGGQSHDIWRVAVETGSLEQLTVASLYHFDLALSRSGQLAFSNNRDGNYEIYSRTEQGRSVRLTNNPALDAAPSWSPSGDTLVFHSNREGALNLWRMTADGEDLRQITFHDGGARHARWSPGAAPQ